MRKGRWNKEYKLVSFDYIITIGCVWDDELEDEREERLMRKNNREEGSRR